jgi:hypothetical protein
VQGDETNKSEDKVPARSTRTFSIAHNDRDSLEGGLLNTSSVDILREIENRPGLPPASLEPHFSVQVLAELWRLDESTVRRIFEAAPGVLRLGGDTRRNGKRDYFTLRIPASVAEREYQRRVVVVTEKNVAITTDLDDSNDEVVNGS